MKKKENELNQKKFHFNVNDNQISIDKEHFNLNSNDQLFVKKMHELLMQALDPNIPTITIPNFDRVKLIDGLANEIRFIASNETIDEAVEEAYNELIKKKGYKSLNKSTLKENFENYAPIVKEEIKAYKLALSLKDQNVDIETIVTKIKQVLKLK